MSTPTKHTRSSVWPLLWVGNTRRLHHWFLFIDKTILGKAPFYLSSVLHAAHNTYHTRSSNLIKFSILSTSTTFGHNAFHFASVHDWNILQNTLKLTSLIPISTFKQNLEKYIVNSCSCWQSWTIFIHIFKHSIHFLFPLCCLSFFI